LRGFPERKQEISDKVAQIFCATEAGKSPKDREAEEDYHDTQIWIETEAEPVVCRQRWEEWKHLALAAGEEDQVKFWTDTDACQGCKYIDEDWCLRSELPCTVNPLLTVKYGVMGMACMGTGYDDGINQTEFDFLGLGF
jgi:hypothetical protein